MKMVFAVFYLVVSILLATDCRAKSLEIIIDLNPSVLSKSEIDRIVGSRTDKITDESRLPDAIKAILQELKMKGFPLAYVDSVSTFDFPDRKEIFIGIECGQQIMLKDGIAEPVATSALMLEARAEAVLDSLVENGFPFGEVRFRPSEPIISTESLKMIAEVDIKTGDFIRLGRLKFPGGEDLGESYLLLESRLKIGQPLRDSELGKAERRLEGLPFIVEVGKPVLDPTSEGIIDLVIPVKTRSATRLSGIAALSPGAAKAVGQVEMEVGNLFRASRSITFSWYGLNPDRHGLKAGIRERWIANKPVGVETSLESWEYVYSHRRTSYRICLIWEPLSEISLGLAGRFERVASLNDSSARLESTTRKLEGLVELDRLDNRWNPSNGWALRFENARGWRRSSTGYSSTLTSGANAIEAAFSIDRAGLFPRFQEGRLNSPAFENWIGYARLENRFTSGTELLEDELVSFGGQGTVRGFIEERFRGRNLLFGSLELRYRPNRNAGYVGVLTDFGIILEREGRLATTANRAGSIGLTGAFQTGAGVMKLDLAWPLEKNFEETRLHLAFTGWL